MTIDHTTPAQYAPMPDVSASLVMIGAILAELSIESPDLAQRVADRVQRDFSHAAVVRLRGPRPAHDVVQAMAEASTWSEGLARLIDRNARLERPYRRTITDRLMNMLPGPIYDMVSDFAFRISFKRERVA